MKDNKTLSSIERQLERERDISLQADKHGLRSRPTASRAIQRVNGIRRGLSKTAPKKGRIRVKHPAKPAPKGAPAREYARRAVVKSRYVASKKMGQWSAHAKYIEREGAQADGKPGVGFGADGDVRMHETVNGWQQAGDQRIYKIMLSPEDGNRLDLPTYTRAVMQDVSAHVGQPLEWVAIDHNNTAHAHVHVLIRGKGIELSTELMSRGIRTICEDHATRALGYKSAQEKRAELDHDITARRYTQLDRLIATRGTTMDGGDILVSEANLKRDGKKAVVNLVETEMRAKRIARLQHLETLGVAERVGTAPIWKLDANWQTALKQLEIVRTRSTMLAQHRELMTDPRALGVVTKLTEGQSMIGRSLGGGIDESDKPYLLVEGIDGRAHFITRSDSADPVKPGTLITLTGTVSKSGHAMTHVMEYDLAIPAKGFAFAMRDHPAVIQSAEDELDRRAKAGVPAPESISPSVGFAGQMQRIIIERNALRKQKQQAQQAKDIGKSL